MEPETDIILNEKRKMGISTGLALEGLIPITCYPRFDF